MSQAGLGPRNESIAVGRRERAKTLNEGPKVPGSGEGEKKASARPELRAPGPVGTQKGLFTHSCPERAQHGASWRL